MTSVPPSSAGPDRARVGDPRVSPGGSLGAAPLPRRDRPLGLLGDAGACLGLDVARDGAVAVEETLRDPEGEEPDGAAWLGDEYDATGGFRHSASRREGSRPLHCNNTLLILHLTRKRKTARNVTRLHRRLHTVVDETMRDGIVGRLGCRLESTMLAFQGSRLCTWLVLFPGFPSRPSKESDSYCTLLAYILPFSIPSPSFWVS